MNAIDPYADFVERAYDAALEPAAWTDVLGRFADLMGGSEANLVTEDEAQCTGAGIFVRSDPVALPLYLNHYIKCNPLLKATDLPLAPRVLTDEDKVPKSELMRTEYYNDFLKRFDAHSLLIVRLAVEPRKFTTVLTVIRPAWRQPFDRDDVENARRLHPHLIRAWRLSSRMSRESPWNDGGGMLLEDSHLAIFLVGAGNIVQRMNRAADALLASGDALSVFRDVLRTATSETTRRLYELIGAARAPAPAGPRGGAMSLARPGRMPLSISIMPVRQDSDLFGFAQGLHRPVLVCVSEPEQNRPVPERELRDVFGLTRMEARLAVQLLAGRDLRASARQLGISFYTVRGHLARMFDKVGVHRQSELVQLLTRATDSLPH